MFKSCFDPRKERYIEQDGQYLDAMQEDERQAPETLLSEI